MTFEPHLTGNIFFLVLAGLVLLWGIQIVFIWRKAQKRKPLKSGLQTILFAAIILFLLQPTWDKKRSGRSYLVYPEGFSQSEVKSMQDSLAIPSSGIISKIPSDNLGELFLLGQDYTLVELLSLPNSKIQWIPFYRENQITAISWDGVLSYGQIQTIKGSIHHSKEATIQLFDFDELQQEIVLSGEEKDFVLEFPALVLGQNEMQLKINGKEGAVIRFFVNRAAPVSYQLLFGFPNPEGRVLTDYLVERGDRAGISSQVSKSGRITMGESVRSQSPEVFILDPGQISNKAINEALQKGNASILILNLNDIEKDISAINQQFKTNFRLKKVGDGPREIQNGVMAAPYAFERGSNNEVFNDAAICIAFHQGNKIAISLLESTFQLALSGDSVQYAGLWEKILATINPPQAEKITVQMPVFDELFSEISLLTKESKLDYLQVGNDSLMLERNPVNEFKYRTTWMQEFAGWKTLSDSIGIYAYGQDELSDIRQIKQMNAFLRDRRGVDFSVSVAKNKIPGIVWLILLLTCFTLVWVEPRFP